jgi:pyruvate/2-oxoglutarate dehydrogenase complex dihydrolipoamide acyltransferase (E2) component
MGEATEAAVELAAEHGVDLADVAGTGSDGSVTKSDVQEHLD